MNLKTRLPLIVMLIPRMLFKGLPAINNNDIKREPAPGSSWLSWKIDFI